MSNQENTFTMNGRLYHITITPFMARQLSDLAGDYGRNLSAIIAAVVNRLHANVASNLRPIPGQETEAEVMPEGDPLTALCQLWQAKQQEVVKVALFDAWATWGGLM